MVLDFKFLNRQQWIIVDYKAILKWHKCNATIVQ